MLDINELEQCYLGCLLLSAAQGMPETGLTDQDFQSVQHGRIFSALFKQYNQGIIPDMMTLARELPEIPPALIAGLTNRVPSGANMRYYEQEIDEAARNRRFIRALQLSVEEAEHGVRVDHIVANLRPALDEYTRSQNKQALFTTKALLDQEFPPVSWIVPGLIGQGLTILSGSPKIGKSWLVLSLAVAASVGGYLFGKLKTAQSSVLYLALEDTPRRLHQRLTMLNVAGSEALTIGTQWQEGSRGLADYVNQHPEVKLVVIDTFGRFAGLEDMNNYAETTEAMARIKTVADSLDIAVVVVHHAKKGVKTDADWLEGTLGSTGLTGAADSIIMLQRDREQHSALLRATGRDCADLSYKLHFDGGCGLWTIAETPLESAPPKKRSWKDV